MIDFKFPRPVIWIGECCYRESALTGRVQPDPRIRDVYLGMIYDGEPWVSHRLSYHLNIAPIPRRPISNKEGLVLHTCDHKWCIRPDHLYLGTQKQNMADMFERSDAKENMSKAWENREPMSDQTKAAIAEGNRGKKRSDEFRERLRQVNLGKKASPEARAKMSASRTGMKQSQETKDKKAAAAARQWANPETRATMLATRNKQDV